MKMHLYDGKRDVEDVEVSLKEALLVLFSHRLIGDVPIHLMRGFPYCGGNRVVR